MSDKQSELRECLVVLPGGIQRGLNALRAVIMDEFGPRDECTAKQGKLLDTITTLLEQIDADLRALEDRIQRLEQAATVRAGEPGAPLPVAVDTTKVPRQLPQRRRRRAGAP